MGPEHPHVLMSFQSGILQVCKPPECWGVRACKEYLLRTGQLVAIQPIFPWGGGDTMSELADQPQRGQRSTRQPFSTPSLFPKTHLQNWNKPLLPGWFFQNRLEAGCVRGLCFHIINVTANNDYLHFKSVSLTRTPVVSNDELFNWLRLVQQALN